MNKKILIIYQTHGNEPVGADIVNKLKKQKDIIPYFDSIVGNPKATKKNIRFIDEDLNRIGNNDLNLQSYESKRSKELFKIISNYEYVIDIHETKSSDDNMLIVSNWSLNKHNTLLKCPVEKIIFWPPSNSSTIPIISSCVNGFELEIGTKTKYKEKVKEIPRILEKTIKNIIEDINETEKREYFGIYGKISDDDIKKDDILINFNEYISQNGESYFPLRFGKYDGKNGYKMARIDKYINNVKLTEIKTSSQLKQLIDENS